MTVTLPPPPAPGSTTTTTGPSPTGSPAITTGPTAVAGTVPAAPGAGVGVVTPKTDGFDTAAMKPMMAMAMARAEGPSIFDPLPGRFPNTVGLPAVLEQLGKTDEGRAAIGQIFALFAAKTGVIAPPDLVAAAQKNPKVLMQALEVTPAAMAAAGPKLNEAYKAGKIKDPPPQVQRLPPQKFDFAKFDQIVSEPRQSTMKPIAPGLFQGSVPSTTTSDAQIKKNRVMAETFQRLSLNSSLPPDQRFEVTFNGKPYTKLPEFIDGLRAAGYQLETSFESRIANFAELKTLVPGSNPPRYADVLAPLMVQTGYRDGQGRVATLPVSHSEMNISLKAGPAVTGPKLDADLKAYQGMSATGFFAAHEMEVPAWLGGVPHRPLSGDQAAKAIATAGVLTDLINTSAKASGLFASGYDSIGVCHDFVATVEQSTTGDADQYPLLMNDNMLTVAIKSKLGDGNLSDDEVVGNIRAALYQLPSDVNTNGSAQRRALASIPWPEGREPFQSTVDARKTLNR